jgi:hypothetical protein
MAVSSSTIYACLNLVRLKSNVVNSQTYFIPAIGRTFALLSVKSKCGRLGKFRFAFPCNSILWEQHFRIPDNYL